MKKLVFIIVFTAWVVIHFSCVSRHITKTITDSTVVEKKAEARKVDSTVNKESEYERETVIEFDTSGGASLRLPGSVRYYSIIDPSGAGRWDFNTSKDYEPINRPIRITIKEKGKAAEQINLSKTEEKKEEKTVEVKKKDVDKKTKSFSWWWLLLLLIPIYYLRKHIISFLKFSL